MRVSQKQWYAWRKIEAVGSVIHDADVKEEM
jgi:hypothetical protein